MIEPIELGCPGHFIMVSRCRWRRHTQVGKYRVSSVGNLYVDDKRTPLGGDEDFFETMVFETLDAPAPKSEGCGCREVVYWGEVEAAQYKTAGEAQAGHERLVQQYREAQRSAVEVTI